MNKEEKYTPDPHWIGKDYYSTPEMAKAAHPALGVGDSAILLFTAETKIENIPTNHYIVTKLNKTISQGEVKQLAADWLFWTGFIMIEYFNGKGQWAHVVTARTTPIKPVNKEVEALKKQLELAMKLVAACTPIVMNTLAYTESGSQDFQQWFATAARDELSSRKTITAILSDVRWKEIKTK